MWMPDLVLNRSIRMNLVIVILHGCGIAAVSQLPIVWWGVIPFVLLSAVYNVLLYGRRVLPGSIERLWLEQAGWYWSTRKGRVYGPYHLDASSRQGSTFVRISLRVSRLRCRHFFIYPDMVDESVYHRLLIFLRWSPCKG